ncbi:MAG: hypothetical protein HRU09_15180 [Oligoflexales bacterium]|nr:hypothetical protein [Oligoflexales bacterium]
MSQQQDFFISEDLKKQYAGLFLLYKMDRPFPKKSLFQVDLPGDQRVLEPLFSWLLEKEYVSISPEYFYEITEKGRDVLEQFKKRYEQFLKEFDIYCAVDLEEGDFAFRYYHEFENEHDWQEFLHEDRWDDLRVAVAEYQGWDFIEIIFMSFLSEDRFGRGADGKFSEDDLFGTIWDEIYNIACSAIRMRSLAYEDSGKLISAQDVMSDMVSQGKELLAELR